MSGCKLEIAMVILWAMATSAIIRLGQAQDGLAMTSSGPSDSARKSMSSDTRQPIAAETTGASKWTAGEAGFTTSLKGGWRGDMQGFDQASKGLWSTAAHFGEPEQPEGVWRTRQSFSLGAVDTMLATDARPAVGGDILIPLSPSGFSRLEEKHLVPSGVASRGFGVSPLDHAGRRSALGQLGLRYSPIRSRRSGFASAAGGRGVSSPSLGVRHPAFGLDSDSRASIRRSGPATGLQQRELGHGEMGVRSYLDGRSRKSKSLSGATSGSINPRLNDPFDHTERQ